MLRKDLKTLKTKIFSFDLRDCVVTKDASGACIIQGYANTVTKDRVGDVVLPAAFKSSLETYLKNPVLLANHDWNDPCGKVLEAKIDEKGLWIKAMISNTREDIKTLVKEGCLRTFSIGYNELNADYDESTKTKYIKDLELLEISIVTVPANAEAMFEVADTKDGEAAKSAPSARTASDIQDFLLACKDAVGKELNPEEVADLCGYLVESKEEIMTVKELIAALKKKSAVPAAAVEGKADAAAPAAAEAAKPAEGAAADPMKELSEKIDMLCEAMSQVLELVQAGNKAEPSEEEKPAEEEKPTEEEKPADEAKADPAPKDEEEEMSDEDVEKAINELNAEIAALEDSENV